MNKKLQIVHRSICGYGSRVLHENMYNQTNTQCPDRNSCRGDKILNVLAGAHALIRIIIKAHAVALPTCAIVENWPFSRHV